jgi:ABC-type glycerol-3-phosphate transport system substrate-binding protein
MVFRGRENPDAVIPEAIDYCLWFTNKENQMAMADWTVPIRMSAIETIESPMLKWFANNVFQYGRQRASADGAKARETVEALEILLQQVFLPGQDVAQAAQEFCQTVESLDWGEVS